MPNGLVGHLYGPVEGKRNDSGMLASSGLLQDLQRFSNSPVTGLPMCVYGDPGYLPFQSALTGTLQGSIDYTSTRIQQIYEQCPCFI